MNDHAVSQLGTPSGDMPQTRIGPVCVVSPGANVTVPEADS